MDFDQILGRVLRTVEHRSFVTPVEGIEDAAEREIVSGVLRALGQPGFDPDTVRAEIDALHRHGRIDRRRCVILLQTVSAHPSVGDLDRVARLIGEEEYEVLKEGGPKMASRLAVVDHHRAVLAYLLGRYEVALDLETRSAEIAPWSDSLANILAILIRLGEEGRARDLLLQIRGAFPPLITDSIDTYIRQDPDLELLRDLSPQREQGEPCDASLLH